MNSPELDCLDRKLIHALQVDGRAPLSRIASVIGVSDRTLGHRFRRLRESSGLRVVGIPNSQRIGFGEWLVRIRGGGGAVPAPAGFLARRQDVSWVGVLAAGTETVCIVRTPLGGEETGLRQALEHVPGTAVITAQCILRPVAGATGWRVRTAALSGEEVAGLRPGGPAGEFDERVELQDGDWRLMRALSRDGRIGFPRLAGLTGWSEAGIRRRLARLRSCDVVRFSVEIAPFLFGYGLEAMVWFKVTPGLLPEVSEALSGHSEVAFAAQVTGSSNLVAMVMCRNTEAFSRYMSERVGPLPGVLEAEAQIVARRTKCAGSLLPGPA